MARYATANDLLAYLRFSRATLDRRIRHDPAFPRPIYIGRTRRFDLDLVDAWLATRPTTFPDTANDNKREARNAA
ncbi:helix-turn-helix transcriptional regulator [Rhodopseudomonas sp.]|uniref:helix-turn-helix transcriptional regulator n=1 Tax=Rhodopseudomonas sp. TaxID=1078 RepID=UPI003B3B2430